MPLPPTRCQKCNAPQPCAEHPKSWKNSKTPRLPGNWGKIRKKVFEKYGRRCIDCGTDRDIEIDHLINRAEGGTDDITNLRPRCRGCHKLKTQQESRRGNKRRKR